MKKEKFVEQGVERVQVEKIRSEFVSIHICIYILVNMYIYTCVYMWDAIFRNKFPPYQTEAENKIRITVKMSAFAASINFPSILSSFHHLPR